MTEADVAVDNRGTDVHLSISGEVDLANADEVETVISSAISNRTTSVQIDLSDVSYLDSAGLRVIYALAVRLRRLHVALRLTVAHGSPARRAIEVSGFDSIARIEPAAGG